MLRRADVAMYHAKASGSYAVYRPAMNAGLSLGRGDRIDPGRPELSPLQPTAATGT